VSFMKNVIFTVLFVTALLLLIITSSIGLPIYCRTFYYAQIEPLGVPEATDKTVEEIKEGYDEVLDYLTLPGREFGAGSFKYSEEGKAHFVDCKVLFDLNLYAFIISFVGATALIILNKRGVFEMWRPFGMNIAFSSGAYALGGFALIGGIVAIDFDKAFTVFHSMFFPGKDNWLFDWNKDQVIRILPQDFFMNCAILIFISIIALCLSCIIFSIISQARRSRA